MNRPDARALIETLAARAKAEADAGGLPDAVGAGAGQADPEELLAYLRGELAPADEERLARRLVADPAAARALLDLAELEAAAGAADEGHLADPETRAGWRDLQQRLPQPPPAPQPPIHRSWLPAWLLPAAAALLLLTSGGLALRVAQLERALREPAAVTVLELVASRSDAPRVEVAPGGWLALTLDPGLAAGESCGDLSAELTGPDAAPRAVAVAVDADGLVNVLLPRPEPGIHRLRLGGCEPRRTLAEHRFRVVAPGGGGGG